MAWRRGRARVDSEGRFEGVIEGQQFSLHWSIVAAAITGSVSFLLLVITNWWNGRRERLTRNREVFSKAFAAVQEYKEFPYVIRRRRKSSPEEERLRISSELRRVQADLAFYSAWLRTESSCVHHRYSELLAQMRSVAGKAMHIAWLEPAAENDAEMNMPDLGLSAIAPYESAYLEEVVAHLSLWPRWLRRFFRPTPKESI